MINIEITYNPHLLNPFTDLYEVHLRGALIQPAFNTVRTMLSEEENLFSVIDPSEVVSIKLLPPYPRNGEVEDLQTQVEFYRNELTTAHTLLAHQKKEIRDLSLKNETLEEKIWELTKENLSKY